MKTDDELIYDTKQPEYTQLPIVECLLNDIANTEGSLYLAATIRLGGRDGRSPEVWILPFGPST